MKTKPGAFLTVAVNLCAVLLAARGFAATPSSGTLSPSAATLTYSAGPFANDNDSAPVAGVTPTCAGDVLPCDQYALKVSIPPSDGTSYIVTVSVGWGNASSDFDLTVLDAHGNEVVQSATAADPEVASFSAAPRIDSDYTILVVPYSTVHGTGGGEGSGGGVTFGVSVTVPVNVSPPVP